MCFYFIEWKGINETEWKKEWFTIDIQANDFIKRMSNDPKVIINKRQ